MEFWSGDNSSIKSILDVLETIYLIFRKTVVQRVAIVKFRKTVVQRVAIVKLGVK